MTDLIHSLDTYEAFREAIRADKLRLEVEWTIGGMTGGSCFNEDPHPHYSVDAEDEPEDEVVDGILEAVVPSLTFLQYRKLMKREVYIYTESRENEYYGNYTEYRKRTLDLEVLYRALKDILC